MIQHLETHEAAVAFVAADPVFEVVLIGRGSELPGERPVFDLAGCGFKRRHDRLEGSRAAVFDVIDAIGAHNQVSRPRRLLGVYAYNSSWF